MKKLTGIFFTAALIITIIAPGFFATAAVGFGVSGVKSFTVSGNSSMINMRDMASAEVVSALESLLNAAETPSPKPSNAVETARITLALTDDTSEYAILADGNGMYAQNGESLLKISTSEFHKVMNAFGNNLYKYRAMPMISGKWGDAELGSLVLLENNSYSFKKLDNNYYRPYYEGRTAAGTVTDEGKWASLSFTVKPESYTVSVYTAESAAPVFTGTYEKAGEYVASNRNVDYTVKITAKYTDTSAMYRGEITYTFKVQKSVKKAADFEIEGNSTYPGEVVVLKINNYQDGDKISFVSALNFMPRFFDDGNGGKIALLPVSYFTAVGEQKVTLTCGSKSQSWSISVKDKKFQIQNLEVDSTTTNATINSNKANNEYEQYIAPLRQVADDKKYWDSFVWPVTGPVSTEFGMIRYVNGAPTSVRHGAIDFAVPKGTPVKATANGRVLYAGFLQLTGNTVLIEHGYGLKSWYYHMDSLDVKTGDMVKASQVIGKVGSTGFSTGAHLHFGMSVNNVFINPSTVLDTDLIKKH